MDFAAGVGAAGTMEYKYLYQTKENENREGVVKAASRADAYAVLRKKGIRPYRLIGDDPPKWRRPAAFAAAAAVAAVLTVPAAMARRALLPAKTPTGCWVLKARLPTRR